MKTDTPKTAQFITDVPFGDLEHGGWKLNVKGSAFPRADDHATVDFSKEGLREILIQTLRGHSTKDPILKRATQLMHSIHITSGRDSINMVAALEEKLKSAGIPLENPTSEESRSYVAALAFTVAKRVALDESKLDAPILNEDLTTAYLHALNGVDITLSKEQQIGR